MKEGAQVASGMRASRYTREEWICLHEITDSELEVAREAAELWRAAWGRLTKKTEDRTEYFGGSEEGRHGQKPRYEGKNALEHIAERIPNRKRQTAIEQLAISIAKEAESAD